MTGVQTCALPISLLLSTGDSLPYHTTHYCVLTALQLKVTYQLLRSLLSLPHAFNLQQTDKQDCLPHGEALMQRVILIDEGPKRIELSRREGSAICSYLILLFNLYQTGGNELGIALAGEDGQEGGLASPGWPHNSKHLARPAVPIALR